MSFIMDADEIMEEEEEDDDFDLFVLTIMYRRREQENSFDNRFLHDLPYRRVLSGTIRRDSLQPPTSSVFFHVYNSQQKEALIQLCGLDRATFDELLTLFTPIYESYSLHNSKKIHPVNKKYGRPRLLSGVSCLGLVLTWTRSRGPNRLLCFLFGILPASCSVWLRFGKRVLVRVLKGVSEARVEMPTPQEVAEFQTLIGVKYPACNNVWAAMDGLKVLLEAAGDPEKQNMFYNGWKCDHYISNLFLFSPIGKIHACYFNAPGSVHDSTMAEQSGIYNKINTIYEATGGKVVVDSAFGQKSRPSLIKSNADNIDRQGDARQNNQLNKEATSIRQLSEWGMRGLQGAFPRLKERIPYEERGERKLFMQLVVYLYNYRTEKVGFNQIRVVYKGPLSMTANELTL
jgi:hypothetical protein